METKKTLVGVAVALALVGAGCSTPASAPSTDSANDTAASDAAPMKYKDFAAGITLYYPADWKSEKMDFRTMSALPSKISVPSLL
ncbi:MAG: hypothetical protein UV18_C0002G0033 [Candidatus Magasanikbacteria bacterium GW2011_GWC2_42_27]|nr:MAG: hypothetical protein UV18_C0002G0033 [Candidatus Magasanikbacteria bacterium GW2011_GWC2_42_27]